jgi:hypothetical protein
MAIQVATLETKIREQAGEIEILKLQLIGLRDDLATAKASQPVNPIAEVIPPNRASRRAK